MATIGNYAFSYCSSLTSFDLPDLLLSIGDEAFTQCKLTTLEIPASVTTIGDNPFILCSALTEITVHPENEYFSSQNGVLLTLDATKIIAYPAGKSDTAYACPETVTDIGNFAFYNCELLTNIDFPDLLNSMGYFAFYGCSSLKQVDLPDSLTIIRTSTFQFCRSLSTVKLPALLKSIENYAFEYCTSLTAIDLPASLISINSDVFDSCTRLAFVTIHALTPPTLGSDVFSDNASGRIIAVPDGRVNTYKSAAGWSTYASAIVSQ